MNKPNMDEIKYNLHDSELTTPFSSIVQADRETQLELMREWFFHNFEDPAERTPYESREGGYIWIWGGPYEAREELESKFCDLIPEDVIEELASELDYMDWAPTPKPSDYDEYLVDDIAQITEFHQNFLNGLIDINNLLEINISEASKNCFYRLIFVNVITALETYLSDAFIHSVVPEKRLMRRFVENSPEFKSEKFSLSDVFKIADEIELRVKSHLADVVWHNLSRIKPMYRDVLTISLPRDMGNLTRAVLKRHDIVHRNGRTKLGEEIIITRADVTLLIAEAKGFVQDIDQKLSEAKNNNWVTN